MLDFLKPQNAGTPMDVKTIRHKLLHFIKEQLQRWEGEGSRIKGMQLFLNPAPDERHLYEAALYSNEEGYFKNREVQKIADDYAIDLPATWTFDVQFTDELPAEAIQAKELPAAIHIATNKKPSLNRATTAYVTVLAGEAEERQYTITPASGKVYIGRESQVQTAEGFLRLNTIAFPATSANEANKYISRQHAHIEWNNETGCFFLFADEGGIPPKNKVKVQTKDGNLIKLQTIQIGHPLQEGDQIILGESALLLFSYSKPD